MTNETTTFQAVANTLPRRVVTTYKELMVNFERACIETEFRPFMKDVEDAKACAGAGVWLDHMSARFSMDVEGLQHVSVDITINSEGAKVHCSRMSGTIDEVHLAMAAVAAAVKFANILLS